MFTEHIHISEIRITSILQMEKLRLRYQWLGDKERTLGWRVGRAGFSSWGCHQLVAGLGEPQPVSGFCLTSEVIGWETGPCPRSQLHDTHGPQAPDGRSCTGPCVSGPHLVLLPLASCVSFLQDPMPCLPVTAHFKGWGMDFYKAFTYGEECLLRGVSLWRDKASVPAPGVQASVSSRGSALAGLR